MLVTNASANHQSSAEATPELDPIWRLYTAIQNDDGISLPLAVACNDMQLHWDASRNASWMVEILAKTAPLLAARCAVACTRMAVDATSTLCPSTAIPLYRALATTNLFPESVNTNELDLSRLECRRIYEEFKMHNHYIQRAVIGATIAAIDAFGPDIGKGHWTLLESKSVAGIAVSNATNGVTVFREQNSRHGLSRERSKCLAEMAYVVHHIAPTAPTISEVVTACRRHV